MTAPADLHQERPPEPILDVRGLSAAYPRRGSAGGGRDALVLHDVSLDVRVGEVVGLVGESGSGKSTLALMTLGLGPPMTSGSIRLSGRDVKQTTQRKHPDAQLIQQDPYAALDPRQRIGAGFAELRRLHRERTAWISDAELMANVGLPESVLRVHPHQLSGGQLQRVSIARAILLRPILLLADEPTSALDVSVQANILKLLLSLREQMGLAILLISHDLAIVRQVCDWVYVLRQGVVVESGMIERVFSSPSHPYTIRLLESLPGHRMASALGTQSMTSVETS